MQHKYIGVFGMMGSGKSVLINEYIHERPEARGVEFTPPPVKASFRGMQFEFVDQIFALQRDSVVYNFYELDAPTINKWIQFIEVTDAIIIAYNFKKDDYFESPEKFISNIKTHSSPDTPLFFVVNNCENIKQAGKILESEFSISSMMSDRDIDIRIIPPATVEYTPQHGRRVNIDISRLDDLYESVIQKISI